MAQFTDELINKIWEKGRKDPKYHPDFVRKDACGAWIIKDKYNDRDSIYGWEVDHIYPESKLKELGVPQELIDNIANLRPLNWKNNVSKSIDYPHYQAKMKADVVNDSEGKAEDFNVECADEKEINANVQHRIEELFKGYRL